MIRVLIIEDDPMVAEINKGYLTSVSGFTCVGCAANGEEALTFLEKDSVDLVLLDIFMPGKNGLALLADIRQGSKGVDVIVISAASDTANIKTALRLGAVDYLIKPFEFERFYSALTKYQQEHELMSQQESISQEELDRQLLRQNKTAETAELPKGLTRTTLQRVVVQIFEMKNVGFSTEDLASHIGVSRVSIRKYLNFLTDIGFVSVDLNYRTVGRPTYTYHLIGKNADKIKPYLKAADV